MRGLTHIPLKLSTNQDYLAFPYNTEFPKEAHTSVAAELPPRSRDTKRLTIGRLIL